MLRTVSIDSLRGAGLLELVLACAEAPEAGGAAPAADESAVSTRRWSLKTECGMDTSVGSQPCQP